MLTITQQTLFTIKRFEIFSQPIQKGKNIFSLKYSNRKKIQEVGAGEVGGQEARWLLVRA